MSDGGPNDVAPAPDACFAYCQASGIVGVSVACGQIVDASTSGACAPAGDAAAITCYADVGPPFICVARATTTGVCGISLSFEDAGTFDADTIITLTPPGCCGDILISTPTSVAISPPCDAGAD